jgi:hypothetical protein
VVAVQRRKGGWHKAQCAVFALSQPPPLKVANSVKPPTQFAYVPLLRAALKRSVWLDIGHVAVPTSTHVAVLILCCSYAYFYRRVD